MLPERLQARIRHQLTLVAPDLEARALATELAELGKRARERLEQCATLIRLGNEQAALQAAEAEPSLPELCAWVSFAGSDEWARLCQKHDLPTTPQPDDAQVLAVELLYGKPIEENHPLYRDYRQAIRERDDGRALSVLRSIRSVNPGDENARAEFDRLGAKFIRDSLAKVTALFSKHEDEAASQLMDRMEQLDTSGLAGNPSWDDAMRRRAEWVQAQSRRRIAAHVERARQARSAGDWRACADEVSSARSLERTSGARAEARDEDELRGCETWAGEHVAAATAEHQARADVEWLRDEWSRLSAESSRRESADLLRRVNHWLDQARTKPGRADPAAVDAASRLGRALHQRLVRRHTARTAAGVGAVLALVLAGHLGYQSLRARSAVEAALITAEAAVTAWDLDAADRALANAADLAATAEARESLQPRASLLRERIREQRAAELALSAECVFLAQARDRGIDATNFAETSRRARQLGEKLSAVGAAGAARLKAQAGDLAKLLAECDKAAEGVRVTAEQLLRELTSAIGEGDTIPQPEKASELAERIRTLLSSPGAVTAVGNDTYDRALALAERAKQRLAMEKAREGLFRRLDAAGDLRAYIAAIQSIAGDAENPEQGAAKALSGALAQLEDLPRSLLGPRAAAMWDAASTSEAPPLMLNLEESQVVGRLADDSAVRNLRKFIIREHRSLERGVNESVPVGSELVVGPVTTETRRLQDGSETVYTAKVLRSSGDVTEMKWSLRSFNNNVVSGKEPTEGLPLPEAEYVRRLSRFFSVNRGQLSEPPLRTAERVRAETGSVLLRAYHLQELFRLAAIRPGESGLAFSPSAQRDAAELRGITQNNLHLTEFAFSNDNALKTELGKFLGRTACAYVEESRFLRSMLASMRRGGVVLVGRVGGDGKPATKTRLAPGDMLLGIDAGGKPAVLFECDEKGEVQLVANPAPLSPLLRMSTTPAEAAEGAGARPASLPPPTGGWNQLLKGKDL